MMLSGSSSSYSLASCSRRGRFVLVVNVQALRECNDNIARLAVPRLLRWPMEHQRAARDRR